MNSIEKRQNDIIWSFERLGDWMDKYEYLIGLGKQLPEMDAALKNDVNALSGCQSSVWMSAEVKNGRVDYFADSDTLITKGLIALLIQVLNRQPPQVITDADLFFIERLGLHAHLSPARANGLSAIVAQMKRLARDHA